MAVPLFDIERRNASVHSQVEEAVLRVLRSGRYVLGPELEAFEEASAAQCGTRHALGVSSGTDALLLALMGLGVGSGHEVITSPFTFASSCSAPMRLSARPVFVDIDPATYNIDPAGVAAAVTADTKAILPIHLFGCPADVGAIAQAAPGVAIVEDAAQAQGASVGERQAGALGTVGCFSFYPTKNLGGYGDGGMVVTSNDDLHARMKLLRVHGDSGGYIYEAVGANFRLDPLQAAAMAVKLPLLPDWVQEKRMVADVYRGLFVEANLSDVVWPVEPEGFTHTYALYVVRVPDRSRLRDHLRTREIGNNVYYPKPMHLQPAYSGLGHGPGDFPHSEKACEEVLAIPMFAGMTEAEAAEVVEAFREFYKK